MSFMKRLFDVKNVRTILVLASVFGIIFLSCPIIDKDNTIAQAQENYRATSYIKIESSGITTKEGIMAGNYGIRESLNRSRAANGDFTLIEIVIGGKSYYILASDVCISETEVVAETAATTTSPKQLEGTNQTLPEKYLILDIPGKSCYKLNNRWL